MERLRIVGLLVFWVSRPNSQHRFIPRLRSCVGSCVGTPVPESVAFIPCSMPKPDLRPRGRGEGLLRATVPWCGNQRKRSALLFGRICLLLSHDSWLHSGILSCCGYAFCLAFFQATRLVSLRCYGASRICEIMVPGFPTYHSETSLVFFRLFCRGRRVGVGVAVGV